MQAQSAVIRDLGEKCAGLAPYTSLTDRHQEAKRRRLLVEAARAISGNEDPCEILRDCAGVRSKTAERIAGARQAARELGANVGPSTEVERAWSVNSLASLCCRPE